jgi:hypothetical protein
VNQKSRRRLIYGLLIVILIPLGLAIRKYPQALYSFIAQYAGDTVWAAMVYFMFTFLFPLWPLRKKLLAAFLFCYLIEISELYQAPWINAIRATWLGGRILGYGFLWSDLACYAVGIFLATFGDRLMFYGKKAKM